MEDNIEFAMTALKKYSPTLCVRELCDKGLTQEQAEEVVFKALARQRAAYQKFQLSKESYFERYLDLYTRAIESEDYKCAKTVLDKILSETGNSIDTEINTSGSERIILKIE